MVILAEGAITAAYVRSLSNSDLWRLQAYYPLIINDGDKSEHRARKLLWSECERRRAQGAWY